MRHVFDFECSVQSAFDAIQGYVDELNKDVTVLPTRGPVSKYTLPADGLTGKLELKMLGAPYSGIACKLDTPGINPRLHII